MGNRELPQLIRDRVVLGQDMVARSRMAGPQKVSVSDGTPLLSHHFSMLLT